MNIFKKIIPPKKQRWQQLIGKALVFSFLMTSGVGLLAGNQLTTPEFVAIKDLGTSADHLIRLGTVEEPLQIGTDNVTVLQWATFLNAVHVIEGDPNDPRHLYHEEMFQEDSPTSFLTAVSSTVKKANNEDHGLTDDQKVTLFSPKEWGTPSGDEYASLPMTGVNQEDRKRYINWLYHGSPSFEELNNETLAITETGTYNLKEESDEPIDPEENAANNKSQDGLFLPSLIDVGIAQLSSYAIEATLGYTFCNKRTLEEITRPFTYQRNLVNFILSIVLAASTSKEAQYITIGNDDDWTVALLAASVAGTMLLTETGAFAVEAVIGKLLKCCVGEIHAVQEGLETVAKPVVEIRDSITELAWPRYLTNIWYIGCNTVATVRSDLAYFHRQQKEQKVINK